MELSDLDCAVMAAKLNADCVREQQAEIRKLRGVVARLQASRKAMKAKLDKVTKTLARRVAKGKRR